MSDIAVIQISEHNRIVGALKEMVRVNALRSNPGITHSEIDAAIAEAIGSEDREREALFETIREIRTAAARGHIDEVSWLAARALAHEKTED